MNPQNPPAYLLLLVGGNPLPNAVAARLIANDQTQVILLYSKEVAAVAQLLRGYLVKQGLPRVTLRRVEPLDPVSIQRAATEGLERPRQARVELHYTGGTKTMAVHAYRALEAWGQEKNVKTAFSYLDARSLKLIYAPNGFAPLPRPVGGEDKANVSLRDLMELHGLPRYQEPRREPVLPQSAAALAQVHANRDHAGLWKYWKREQLKQCRRSDTRGGWKPQQELADLRLVLPTGELVPVAEALRQELGLAPDALDFALGAAAQQVRESNPAERERGFNPVDMCQWLDGIWLEQHVLTLLKELEPTLNLHDCTQNIRGYLEREPDASRRDPSIVLEARGEGAALNETSQPEVERIELPEFEVDVVALRGYQLFAFSCSTEANNRLLKLKLFEAFVRARQLGGEEARLAAISCSDDPDGLEKQMRSEIDPEGQSRAFGRKHLAELRDQLASWIRKASGEL